MAQDPQAAARGELLVITPPELRQSFEVQEEVEVGDISELMEMRPWEEDELAVHEMPGEPAMYPEGQEPPLAAPPIPKLEVIMPPEPQYSGRFTGEEPAFYDRGLDLVVVFYYVNAKGKRVVVTTVAPKDPDSGRLATEHIVTLDQGESFHATFASNDPTVKPVHVMLKTAQSTVRPEANH